MAKTNQNIMFIHKSVVNAFNIKLKRNIEMHGLNGKKGSVKNIFQVDDQIALGTGWSVFAKQNDVQFEEFILGRGNKCKEMHVQILRGNARIEKLSQHQYLLNSQPIPAAFSS